MTDSFFTTPFKSASQPFQGKGVYIGVVESVVGNLLSVSVPRLSGQEVYENVEYVSAGAVPQTGEKVVVAFHEGRQDELIVLGRLKSGTLPSNALGSIVLGDDTSGDFVQSLVAGTGVTLANNVGEKATPTISIGQSVATSASPTFNALALTGGLTVGGVTGLSGSLTLRAGTTTVGTAPLYLASGTNLTSPAAGAVEWDGTNLFVTQSSLARKTVAFTDSSITGNAATATTLQTARNINGVAFNGSADITVTAAAGTLTGTTLASGVTASSLTSVGTLGSLSVTGTVTAGTFSGSGASLTNIPNSATTATNANTASAIVARDASGNFTAGTITATTFSGAHSGSGASLTNIPNSATTATSANTASAIVARDASGNFTAGTITATAVTGLGTPSNNSDAANKAYVDSIRQGLDVKDSVRVATTTAGTLASSFANTSVVDGITLATGDRILIKDQATTNENGIYTVNATGAPTRATDADTSAKVTPGMFVFVEQGTTNADSGWVLTTDSPITLGTTGLTFAQFSGAGQITAGAGLTKTGNTIDVGGTTNRITVAADSIDIASTYVGQASITTLGTVTTGTWNASTITADRGGTGQASYTIGDILYASGTTALTRLAGVATGNVLISGGVGAAPSWGKVGLTTHVSGTLGVANGGTGAATLSGYVYGNGTGVMTASTTIPATSLTGTIDAARLSGAYTGITGVGTLNGLTVGTSALSFTGSNGVNWSAYGGSIWMQDTTWIRADKSFYNGGNTIANDGYLSIGNGGSTDASWPTWLNKTRASQIRVTGASDSAGNIQFAAANPYIVASDYIIMPGGLFVNGGNLWVANTCHVRGSTGLYNDTGSLIISGGSSGIMSWASTGFQTTASTSGYQALYWGTTFGNIARFTSTRKLKENIATLTDSGAVIDALRPVTFVAKATGNETDAERDWRLADIQHGFIAEEVAEVDGGRWAVWEPDEADGIQPIMWRHHDMTALLVAEVKSLRARVATLEAAQSA